MLPEGREPHAGDWGDHSRKCIGYIMDGNAISELSETGYKIRGDTLLILINAQFQSILSLLSLLSLLFSLGFLDPKQTCPSSCPTMPLAAHGSSSSPLTAHSSTASVLCTLKVRDPSHPPHFSFSPPSSLPPPLSPLLLPLTPMYR